MKATELMIGDWGMSDSLAHPARYSGIFTEYHPNNEPPYRRLRFMYEGDVEGMDIPEDKVMPIPLTPEILEANGFEYREDDNEWWHYDDYPFSDFQIGYEDDDDMRMMDSCNTTNIRVNYVHELQHALRACRLDDLADNFEVPREPGQTE